jgi:putative sigma-54 modulation protein
MNINISGHHIDITDSIREAIESKMGRVCSHNPDIQKLDVIVKVDGSRQSIEVATQYHGASISVTAVDKDLYVAIQQSVKKLDAALEKRKGVLKASRESLRDDVSDFDEVLDAEEEDEFEG